jgi:hypothetical protein
MAVHAHPRFPCKSNAKMDAYRALLIATVVGDATPEYQPRTQIEIDIMRACAVASSGVIRLSTLATSSSAPLTNLF